MKKDSNTANLPDSILGVSLTDKQKEILRSGKETELIKGLLNKDGERFDAFISLNEDNKFQFRLVADDKMISKTGDKQQNGVKMAVEKWISEVNLVHFASLFGFEISVHNSPIPIDSFTGNIVVLINKSGIELAIYLNEKGIYQFVQLGTPHIAGDPKAFFVQYVSPFPCDLIIAMDRFIIEQGKKSLEKKESPDQTKEPKLEKNQHGLNYESVFKTVYGLEDLNTREWLYNSQIKDASLDHTFFRGRILSFKATTLKKSKKKWHDNPVFPLFTDDGISGFAYPYEHENDLGNHRAEGHIEGQNIEGRQINGQLVERQDLEDQDLETHGAEGQIKHLKVTGKGVWLSNIINEQKIRRLIIVSHPLEALAYHQMYSKPSDLMSLYMSCCSGNAKQDVYWAQKIINRYKPEQVIIATEKTESGLFTCIYLLGQLSEANFLIKNKNNFKEENSEIRFSLDLLAERNNEFACLTVKLTFLDFDKGIFMNENLSKYFDQINKRETAEHPEFNGIPPFQIKTTHVAKHTSTAEVIFPLRRNLLSTAEKIVQHLRPILFLKAEYPHSLSFLEDMQIQSEQRLTAKENRNRKAG